jgi:hypothetical protein
MWLNAQSADCFAGATALKFRVFVSSMSTETVTRRH